MLTVSFTKIHYDIKELKISSPFDLDQGKRSKGEVSLYQDA
jgi:hypothetical protein